MRRMLAALSLAFALIGVSAADARVRCPCMAVDCGCGLARALGISDEKQGRRLWVARNYLTEFPRVQFPSNGDVVVLSRRGRGKGHVGLFRGFDASGNPIVESFRCHGSVGTAVYSRGRVLGYVRPP